MSVKDLEHSPLQVKASLGLLLYHKDISKGDFYSEIEITKADKIYIPLRAVSAKF